MTSDLVTRALQHKHGVFEGFSAQYACKQLVWYEPQMDLRYAISREKQIKRWRRAWKLTLIEALNPDWRDLSDGWFEPTPTFPRDHIF